MDRREWLTRGLASALLTAFPLQLAIAEDSPSGPSLLPVAGQQTNAPTPAPSNPATPRPLSAGAAAPSQAQTAPGKSNVYTPRNVPRLTATDQQAVASALSAAETLARTSVTASSLNVLPVDEFALQQDAILSLRISAARLRADSTGRLEALQQHAEALRGLCERLERRATSGDASVTAELTAARAYQAVAEAQVMAEVGEAASVRRTWKRAADVTQDLLVLRMQDARRGTTTLPAVAHAANLAVRAAQRAGASDTSFNASAQLESSLKDAERIADARARSGSHVADPFAPLLHIEANRAALLWKTAKSSDGKSIPARMSEAERLADSLFRQQTDPTGASLERLRTAAVLWQSRDDFHETLSVGGTVSQVIRNESALNLARLTALRGRLNESSRNRAPMMTGKQVEPDALTAATTAHIEVLSARLALRPIERRLSGERLSAVAKPTRTP
ncbi:MAG: hypothetical protein IT428_24200 [Planctomycetaceae bacterium]|nr:hypothetical protein [Planctomycetaceae bacterium]